MSLSEEQLEKRRAQRREYYRKNRRRIINYQKSWQRQNVDLVRDYNLKTWKRKIEAVEKGQKID